MKKGTAPATFRPPEHIRRRADFKHAYESGAKVSGRYMTLFVRPNTDDRPRLGIAATRRIGGAVARNRTKRLIRELFRQRKPTVGLDIVVVPRRETLDAPFASLQREFNTLLERAARVSRAPAEPRRRRPGRPRADSRV